MTFEEFWRDILPAGMRKGSKTRSHTRFIRIERGGKLAELLAALDSYCEDQRANPWRAFQYCSTWLGDASEEPWRQWYQPGSIEAPQPPLAKEGELILKAEYIQKTREREKQPFRTIDEIMAVLRSGGL